MDYHISCVYGNNKYRDSLIYNIVYEYVNSGIVKFGVVIGKILPYYEYISDNIYIKYDDKVMKDYLENIQTIYKKNNGTMDNSLLIIDSNLIDLNTEQWDEILENYQIYKINIVIILDKIMDYNIKKLNKYVNTVYILKQIDYNYDLIIKLYKTFFKKYDRENFIDSYIECTHTIYDIMIANLNSNRIFKYKINTSLPRFIFNTYKIYEQNKIYKKRCIVSDIINV